MNPLLPQLAEFLSARAQWVIDRWIRAVARQPEIESANDLTYQQLVDHLPLLFHDLTRRLSNERQEHAASEIEHAHSHGRHRWHQGYTLEEVIREASIIRRIVSLDCLDDFARHSPGFDTSARAEAETVIEEFFNDMLVESAQQFAEERQKDLGASEQNLQAILDSALDSIIVIGQDGRVREWNPAAEYMFGYRRAEAVGQELAQLIIPTHLRDRHRQGLGHYLATGEGPLLGKRIEVPAIRADGSDLLVELAITPYRVHGEALFTAYLRDITTRAQNEARRAAQYAVATLISGQAALTETGSQILETIARSGPWVFGGFWIVNDEGQLVCHATWRTPSRDLEEFQTATEALTFSPGEGLPARVIASGKPAWIADVTAESNFPRREVARKAGLHGALLFPLLAPSGVNGVIELLSEAVLAPDEDLLRLVGALGIEIGLYIERKRSEEELRRQKEAAEEANQAKDRFLAALSHELRTPLNPVLMWACATAEDKNLDGDMREGLKMVCRNVEMEARLIDDLLDLTRIARGKLQLNLQPCDAGALLQHALEIVRSQLTGKNLHLSIDLQASNHEIIADATRIEQVFWNLLKNAHKFTPENGEIVVRSYDAAPGVLAFEVSDSGRGIEQELMPKLFTAFEQGIASGGGLGLGLAICKAIVQMHGGSIHAANKPDGPGAILTVELNTVADAGVNAPLAAGPEVITWRRLRILIVEDHGHTAAVMSRLLKREGHEVATAQTVREALDVLRSKKLDLLVSDLGLPDGNGFEVMRELAKISDAKGIAVSGYGMDEDIQRSSEAGFSAHLTKPINVQELQETIQRVTADT